MSFLKDLCADIFSDSALYTLKRGKRALCDITSSICTSARRNISDYCENESSCAVKTNEFDAWRDEINELDKRVAAMDAKINKSEG